MFMVEALLLDGSWELGPRSAIVGDMRQDHASADLSGTFSPKVDHDPFED
jgi:hypothetical protein